MVRAKVTELIRSKIEENPNFNYCDFIISPKKESFSTTILIKYEYNPQYYIEIKIPNSKTPYTKQKQTMVGMTTETIEYADYSISGTMCPGQLAIKEDFNIKGVDGINISIGSWLQYVWEDLMIEPQNRMFKKQEEEIEKIKEKVNGIPDGYFSAEEGKDLKERLDKMESYLAEKLSAENLDKKDTKKQIDKLHKEIEVLKQTIFSLNKSGWFKSMLTKTLTWLSDPTNQKLLKAGKDLVIKMIPEQVPQE